MNKPLLLRPSGKDYLWGGQRLNTEFEKGIELKDAKCLGASLDPVDGDYQVGKVIIKQGMYHQIKRMFSHFSINVVELKRIKMGSLDLDKNLKMGECRYLTKEEISSLCDK